MFIGTLIADAVARGIDRTDAELLLAHVLATERVFVLTHPEAPVDAAHAAAYADLAARRAAGEPIAYLTGTKEFYGRAFTVTPATLIPRPETEMLVDRALTLATTRVDAGQQDAPLIVADSGTGSGAIIVTVAAELAARHTDHRCGFIATDIAPDALAVADANARTHGVDRQIAFLQADLLAPLLESEPLARMLRLGAHLLVCANLPYVDSATRDMLLARPESRGLAFEPADALWADDGGLALYDRLLTQLAAIATTAGGTITILCEVAPDQATRLVDMTHTHLPAARTTIHPDLTGRDRVVEISIYTSHTMNQNKNRAENMKKSSF